MMAWIKKNKWCLAFWVLFFFTFFAAGSLSGFFENAQEYFIKDGLAGKAGWTTPVISEHKMSFWTKKADGLELTNIGSSIDAAINEYRRIYPDREIKEINVEVSLKYK